MSYFLADPLMVSDGVAQIPMKFDCKAVPVKDLRQVSEGRFFTVIGKINRRYITAYRVTLMNGCDDESLKFRFKVSCLVNQVIITLLKNFRY